MKRILVTGLFALVAASSSPARANTPAAASGTVVASRADLMALGQQKASTVCVACHGLDGMSAVPTNPNIAGMPEQYIAKQLELFKEGKRQNPIMQGMAAALTPDEMKGVGIYYFSQRPKANATARDLALAAKGQKIFRAGIPELKVPACAGCHGAAGAGIPAVYPRLAGQWPDYIAASLEGYATDTRKNAQMNAIAKRMRPDDRRAVTEYVAGMRAK